MFIPRFVPYSAIADYVFQAYNQLCIPQLAMEKWAIEASRIDANEVKDTELFIPFWKIKFYLMKNVSFCFLNQALSEAITKHQLFPDAPDDSTATPEPENTSTSFNAALPASLLADVVSEEKTAPAETPKPKNPSTKKPQRRKKKAK